MKIDIQPPYRVVFLDYLRVVAVFMVLLFLASDRIPSLTKLREVRVVSFARKHSLTLYLLNCPFIYIYFRICEILIYLFNSS